jgi:hypothetical protein
MTFRSSDPQRTWLERVGLTLTPFAITVHLITEHKKQPLAPRPEHVEVEQYHPKPVSSIRALAVAPPSGGKADLPPMPSNDGSMNDIIQTWHEHERRQYARAVYANNSMMMNGPAVFIAAMDEAKA